MTLLVTDNKFAEIIRVSCKGHGCHIGSSSASQYIITRFRLHMREADPFFKRETELVVTFLLRFTLNSHGAILQQEQTTSPAP